MSKKKVPEILVVQKGRMRLPFRKVMDSLFHEIKHGDREHQKWLWDKITSFCDDMEKDDPIVEAIKFRLNLGEKLSDIINQDGDDKNDGQVVDEIVSLLKKHKLYKERK